SRDFYNCVNASSNAESWDGLCVNVSDPGEEGEFKHVISNIAINSDYSYTVWTFSLDDTHPAKRLGYYVSPVTDYEYEDNVGYDTLITDALGKKQIVQARILANTHKINLFPNPFYSEMHLSGDIPLEYSVYNIEGRHIETLDGHSTWKPDENTEPGIYLIKARMPDFSFVSKKVVYIK
ncbi:MAG: T9SS type A sorting domain-containing protein, partial [Candidatus Zixiibacteriota bacterium]